MKLIEKIAERVGSFSPTIIFILICISYLSLFENQTSYPEQFKKKTKQVDKRPKADNELQAYWLFRD